MITDRLQNVIWAIEKLGASEELTNIVVELSDIINEIKKEA